MASTIHNITFDCADPYTLALWWSEVVNRPIQKEDEPGDPEAMIHFDNGPTLLFIRVPEGKSVKNRVHLDLCPDDTRDAEVERLLGHGASLVTDHRRPDGTGWVLLADPEGNEFCVERSAVEKEQHSKNMAAPA
ncbi:VOC family protein [Actinokineospora xionganensis]|uniref:VOC family protein n=1 Tax=Actinokineospora xionganensis TaxID=2684470 RepID=A0ABR7LA87_9PSEU|nr:VOC family protein [Actinokineospora xionganensis]MBC6449580.1 VOC family protein [Actinokineospora xionganensis]